LSFLTAGRIALILILLVTVPKTSASASDNGGLYCISLTSSKEINQLEKVARKLDCSTVPCLRIEKAGSRYILTAGWFKTPESAKAHLQSLKGSIPSPQLRRCSDTTIVKILCPCRFELSLRDLGYPQDVIMSGTHFQHTFYIPILPDFKKGAFLLKVSLSPAADPEGRITVKINDIPYKTYKIKDTGYSPTLKIPLIPDRHTNFSKINVSFNFIPEKDVCKTLNKSGIYAVIHNGSRVIVYTKKGKPQSIYQYLLDYAASFSIYSDSLFETAKTAYFLAGLYKEMSLYNLSFPGPKKIIITSEEDISRVEKGRLFLNPKDTNILKLPFMLKSNVLSLNEFSHKNTASCKTLIPIREFGFKTTTLEGVGDITYQFSIPSQRFRGKPEKMTFLLRFSAQEVNPDSGDRLWCNLFVNNQLVWSREITPYKGVNSIQEYLIEIPDYSLLSGTNTFKVSFSYYPGGRTCMGPIPKIKTTLFDTSAISVFRVKRSFENVRDLLSSLSGSVGVVIDNSLPQEFVEETFKLLGYFNPHINQMLDSSKLSENSTGSPDFFIVVTPLENLKNPENTPVIFDNRIVIVNPLTKEKILDIDGNYKFILFQSGHLKGKPALFITPSHIESCDIINELNWSDLNRLIGNADFVFSDSIYPLEIGKKFRVKYSTETRLEFYLKKYKIVLFIFAFFVVTLFIVYIWRRLT